MVGFADKNSKQPRMPDVFTKTCGRQYMRDCTHKNASHKHIVVVISYQQKHQLYNTASKYH